MGFDKKGIRKMKKRLTIKKTSKNYITRYYKPKNVLVSDLTWKLGQYEDIEEKFGIGLDIFAKSIVNGFYGIWNNKIVLVKNAELVTTRLLDLMGIIDPIEEDKFCFESYSKYWILEDYGKTWALTRKELEK